MVLPVLFRDRSPVLVPSRCLGLNNFQTVVGRAFWGEFSNPGRWVGFSGDPGRWKLNDKKLREPLQPGRHEPPGFVRFQARPDNSKYEGISTGSGTRREPAASGFVEAKKKTGLPSGFDTSRPLRASFDSSPRLVGASSGGRAGEITTRRLRIQKKSKKGDLARLKGCQLGRVPMDGIRLGNHNALASEFKRKAKKATWRV